MLRVNGGLNNLLRNDLHNGSHANHCVLRLFQTRAGLVFVDMLFGAFDEDESHLEDLQSGFGRRP